MIVEDSLSNTESESLNDIDIRGKYLTWTEQLNHVLLILQPNELTNDFKKERFQKQVNKCSFALNQKKHYIFDCYHEQAHYRFLKNFIGRDIQDLIVELDQRIINIDNNNHTQNKIKVLSEFGCQEFMMLLKEPYQNKNRYTINIQLIGKRLMKKIDKLKQFKKMKDQLIRMSNVKTISKSLMCSSLQISPKFLEFSLSLIEMPEIFKSMELEIENKIAQITSMNDRFLKFFVQNQIKCKTRQMLFQHFKKNNPDINIKSLNDFDRKLIKGNKITYQKCKFIYQQKNERKKEQCRILFINQLVKLIELKQDVCFFDETSFEINSRPLYAYGIRGNRPNTIVRMAPIYVRLLMIVSLTKVEAAIISFEPVKGSFVYQFIRHFVYTKQFKFDYNSKSSVLVMDNCPKNRINKIKKLANDGYVNIMYTVPCSPFTNLVESVFNLVKQNIKKDLDYPFK